MAASTCPDAGEYKNVGTDPIGIPVQLINRYTPGIKDHEEV